MRERSYRLNGEKINCTGKTVWVGDFPQWDH